ncbi:hypothetical protein IU11_19200, partial [Cellulosimicrobium sp. MM]
MDAGRTDTGRTTPRAPGSTSPGVPDLRHVPRDAWLRAAREALGTSGGTASNDDLGQPPPPGTRTRAPSSPATCAGRGRHGPDDAVVLTRGATDGMPARSAPVSHSFASRAASSQLARCGRSAA